MQGKGLVKFFLVVLTIVCLYQLSFTWVANSVEKKAQSHAETKVDPTLPQEAKEEAIAELRSDYLTEQSNKNIYNIGIAKYNYTEVKERALNLGLDLQGGMSVVLEVSKYDLIKQAANNPKNPDLIAALDKARIEEAKGNGDLIDLFAQYYEERKPGSQLVTLFKSQDNSELEATATNSEVVNFLKEAAKSGFDATFTKLQQRIDKFGVAAPYLSKQENTGRILIELPGVDNPKNVRQLLQSTANLQFWETWQYGELADKIQEANSILKGLEEAGSEIISPIDTSSLTIVDDTTTTDTSGSLANEDDNSLLSDIDTNSLLNDTSGGSLTEDSADVNTGPLAKVLTMPQSAGSILGYVNKADTAQLMDYLRKEEVRSVFPSNIIFMLGAEVFIDPTNKEKTDLYELYAVKPKLESDEPLLEGDIIRNAAQTYDQTNGRVQVTMSMKSDGAKQWARITEENIGKSIAIVLDNRVYSAPTVNDKISGGSSVISGNFDVNEAQTLANILETGKLPVPSRIVQEDIVGPSLGAESIRDGIISMIVGLILVVIFMAVYYSTAGLIADLALFANIFFIFGVLSSIGATLTLPGIAGLVLTMGMAVDANVIIYERIREELAKGKSTLKAISDGYKGSYSAIIDSHVTTFIIGLILNEFGSGAIKGFAIVLMIGIIFSLFTAIFISRLILDWMARTDKPIRYYTRFTEGAFKKVNFKFLQKRRYGYIFSGIITVIGLIAILTSGFNYGVEFQGGRSYTVKFENSIKAEEVRDALSKDFDPAIQVKTFGSSDKLKITTTYLIGDADPNADSLAAVALYEKLQPFYPQKLDYKTWDTDYKLSQMKVEPTIAEDIKTSALKAIIIALLCTFIYIFIRFRRWQFGLGAVIALMHDAFMTLAMFSILKNVMPFTLQLDETFVAAILTIIGYSIMDTVVVYDRIREFLRESHSGTLVETFNSAINQTLSRTVITSGVTILSILAILFFGTENIQGFAFAMVIGIGFGTYSSVFIASALTVDLFKKEHHEKQITVTMKGK
ncbi:MAG: protein translocase subunit SecDF [Fimbriimonadaceae bacterium]|nr:protein translocase subunit SecDF [Chitinophagales bacterium]